MKVNDCAVVVVKVNEAGLTDALLVTEIATVSVKPEGKATGAIEIVVDELAEPVEGTVVKDSG